MDHRHALRVHGQQMHFPDNIRINGIYIGLHIQPDISSGDFDIIDIE